ncbi:DUF937 domain-containing protein [Amylibacter sp. IMCC11727]|uniref:DUF937 domain-containing protein n=1 Tax=Amylibacter sp. IMCC11727 TaxID=3039851 RepID=UPI00244DC2AC|nr:DUF937 domain-containing protein [Amylibacter sp. IMCC11727]WGI21568.1 DUF937 domain-containing protein [Amylibacter sp. IMCC11727]
MSLMNLLQQAQGGQGLSQLASQFGIDEGQANQLTEMLAPTIGQAAKQKAQSGGLEGLLGALHGEGQGELYENAAAAAAPEGQAQGMAFLEQLMGGQEAPQEMAAQAANKTGIDMATIMQFLPALAGMLQGGMQKQVPDDSISGMLGQLTGGGSGGGGLMGMVGGLMGGGQQQAGGGMDLGALTQLLDADGDGSPLNDVLGKFMK